MVYVNAVVEDVPCCYLECYSLTWSLSLQKRVDAWRMLFWSCLNCLEAAV